MGGPLGIARLHLPLVDMTGTTESEQLRAEFGDDVAPGCTGACSRAPLDPPFPWINACGLVPVEPVTGGRSPAGVAAVDDEVAAGHEGGGRAGEVEHGAGDLLDLTEPLHRGTACAEFHHRVRDALVDPGQDVARADGVDADLVPDPLRGLGLRQVDDAGLGRAVGGAAS